MTGEWWSSVRLLTIGVWTLLAASVVAAPADTDTTGRLVLEDFHAKDETGFPSGWRAQRNDSRARGTYQVKTEDSDSYLAARFADQRVYRRNMDWNPKQRPVMTWRWRLKAASAEAEPIAAVFVALDTDLMMIPVLTKYVWSANRPKGSTTEGGIFSASEIVIRSGPAPIGQWVEERVNAYEDFKRIHQHEPAEKAWGISLLASPGVEIDFGPLVAEAP